MKFLLQEVRQYVVTIMSRDGARKTSFIQLTSVPNRDKSTNMVSLD